ncbi:MAG: alpha/beta hydrolase [Crocinitomicaceae bacterium]|nr:alpha/beta hydrolase [Crocinitomicaceae bacterium]
MNNSLLHYQIIGEGAPIVFLHGFLEDSSMWEDVKTAFPKHQLLLIDLPGHGESPSYNLEAYSMKFMAEKVDEIIKDRKIENPIVIGHSMGGYVGLELLKIRSLRRLILFNSNFWEDSEERIQNRNRVIEVVQKNKLVFLNEAIRNLFYVENDFTSRTIQDLIQKAKEINELDIIKSTKGLRDRLNNKEIVSTYSEKICVVQAENDPIIPSEYMEDALNQLTKKPKFYMIENSGHMSVWENLKATRRILTEIVS